MLFAIIFTSFFSMLAVLWIYFKMLRIAHDKNLVDNPGERKLQEKPVPLVGGICVFFGVISATLLASCLMDCTGLVPILMSMSVMLFLGTLDDLITLTPRLRFVAEILIVLALIFGSHSCIDNFHGLWGIHQFSWYFAVPLTIFACVGIINAINMIDGVNGLSSGICITCSFLFGISFYQSGDYPNAMLCFAMAWGLVPFIIHNVIGKTSKMYIGDGGTMIMGILMAWCVIQVLRSDSDARWLEYADQGMNVIALTLAILSVPVFDTIRVMSSRIVKGISPFKADKTHLHHIIYDYGQSHSITALTEILLDLCITGFFFITYKLGLDFDFQLYAVILLSAILIWGTYYVMNRNYRLNTGFFFRMRKAMASAQQGDKNWWLSLQKWVDNPHKYSK